MSNTINFKFSRRPDKEKRYHIFIEDAIKSLCKLHTSKSFLEKNPGDDLICMDCYGAQITLEELKDKKTDLDDVFISSRSDNIDDLFAESFDYEEAMKMEKIKDVQKNKKLNEEERKLEAKRKRDGEKRKRDEEKRVIARKRRQVLIEQKQKQKKQRDAVRLARATKSVKPEPVKIVKLEPDPEPEPKPEPVKIVKPVRSARPVKPVRPIDISKENITDVRIFTKRALCRVIYTVDGVRKSKAYGFDKYSGQDNAIKAMKNDFGKFLID